METIPGKTVTPLWIVAAFVTLTETVLGYAITQVQDGVQIALTSFVIIFGLFVAIMFFVILWNRPFVFYPPSEYRDSDPTRFVEAMRLGMNKFQLNFDQLNKQLNLARTEIVNEAIRDVGSVSDNMKQQLESAVSSKMEQIQKHVTKLQEVAGEIEQEFIGSESLRKRVLDLVQSEDYHPMTSYGIAKKLELGVPEVSDILKILTIEGLITTNYAGRFTVYAPKSAPK